MHLPHVYFVIKQKGNDDDRQRSVLLLCFGELFPVVG